MTIEHVMKTAVDHLLKRLYLGHLLVQQEQQNPLSKNIKDSSIKSLEKSYPVHEIVLNKSKYRSMITLGLVKSNKPINKNDYHLDLHLTPLGLKLCQYVYGDITQSYKYAQNDKHWWSKDRPANFWFGNNFFDTYDYDSADISRDDLEKWILKEPSAKVYAHLKDRPKFEKALKNIYKAISFSDSDDDNGGGNDSDDPLDPFSDDGMSDDLLDPLNPLSPFN